MRVTIFSVIVGATAILSNGRAAADDNYTFQAYGLGYGQSCKDFVEISSDPNVGRYAFTGWIQGFLSGIQLGASRSPAVKRPSIDNIDTLMKLLTAYCSENPQIPFLKAVLLGIYFEPPRGQISK